MSYWSFGKDQLALRGVEGTVEVLADGRAVLQPDPDNPAVLQEDVILYALRTSRRARADFNRILPTLLPEEQDRLRAILEANPRVMRLMQDDQRQADSIQSRHLRIPVRTVGRRGGKGSRGA